MEDSNKALEQCLQESEMSISERLDPSPKHDAGHYVDLPLVRNEKTLEIADGETFEKVYVLGGDTEALTGLPFANVIVGAGAKVNIVVVIMPGTSIDLPLAVDIVGEGADVNVSGLYLCGGDEKVGIRTEVRHRVPSCTSNQLFNGIAAGHAVVKFYGKSSWHRMLRRRRHIRRTITWSCRTARKRKPSRSWKFMRMT